MNAPAKHDVDWMAQYEALGNDVALVDLGHRTQIEVGGADRASFLHNLSTNEIRKLSAGSGCEAFLTTAQGKTLAHAFVFATSESLVIDTVAGEAETILNHLNHYLVCERVELADRSHEWSELLLSGPNAKRLLEGLSDAQLPEARLANATGHLADRSVSLRRADLAGPGGFLISARSEDVAAVRAALERAGAVPCGNGAFEAARIEWGFPCFTHDISDNNLPQEVARDARAISFTKGCYLGQETVARIDALGHVNKTLVGIRFEGPSVPPLGLQLSAAGQVVGQVTSAAYSPRLGTPLALGYVRRGSNAPATRLTSPAGAAEVVALPIV
jgi:folate-binding protein YgfZ